MDRSTRAVARSLAVLCATALAIALLGVGAAGAAKGSKSTVAVATAPGVGAILVDGRGRALYTLTDAQGAAVDCTGTCAQAWPPLTVTAGSKAKAAKRVTKVSAASDGQVTWDSLPLYRFSGDTKPKQANGEGLASFGGTWHVVKAPGSAGATSSNGSGSN